ncbi:Hsp70 family protein [Actinoplanes sp. GCM10030250]|uniref:Hsp70 family protein n=1 Tax=Actinoplanes sp. GCM10030250 TaxID=3273376 RepID=UPI00362464C2
MPAGDLHLAVDISAWWTTAVYESGGTVQPVVFEGRPRLPSGVFQARDTRALSTGTPALAASVTHPEDYRPDPMTLLQTGTPAPGARFDPVAAVAAVLVQVAEAASVQAGSTVTALTIITAQTWGHRARQRLHQAAATAGLPPPHIVTAAAAAAAAALSGSTLTGGTRPGSFVAVCTTGDATPELTVIDAAHGFQQLAAAPVRDPGAPTVDEALIQLAAERATPGTDPSAALDDWRVAREIQQARTALAVQPRAPMLLPEPHPAVVLTRDDLAAAGAAHLARLRETVKQLLADADLDPSEVNAVVLVGDDGTVPEVQAALAGAGLPPTVTVRDPHAVLTGAVRLSSPPMGLTEAPVRIPRTRPMLGAVSGAVLVGACSIGLLIQVVSGAPAVPLPLENVTLSAALAALTAWAVALLAPGGKKQPEGENRLRRGFVAAAAIGIVLAWLYGLVAGVSAGDPTETSLRSALAGAVPIAACAAVIALVAPRLPAAALPEWLRTARPPALPVAMAALGVGLQRVTGTDLPLDMLGATLLGIATGLTVPLAPTLRLVTALLLGAGYALVSATGSMRYPTIAYVAVLAWWAATTTATAATATPRAGTRTG